MYGIRILPAATGDLAGLDGSVRGRIVERMHWLSANLDRINPQALTGELAGLHRLRVGDFRVIYQILRDEQTIIIHAIGHRREIYRERR